LSCYGETFFESLSISISTFEISLKRGIGYFYPFDRFLHTLLGRNW